MSSDEGHHPEGHPSNDVGSAPEEHTDSDLYSESENFLFGSPDFRMEESHVGEMIGICNIFTEQKCHSCEILSEQHRNLEVTAQTQQYNMSVAQATNRLLKNKLQELEERLKEGGAGITSLQAAVEAAKKDKLELEEKLKVKLGQSSAPPAQTQVMSTTTLQEATSTTTVVVNWEHHGLNKLNGNQGQFCSCLCGTSFCGVKDLYSHLEFAMTSEKTSGRNVSISCSGCGRRFTTWNGLVKHSLKIHGRSLQELLQQQ